MYTGWDFGRKKLNFGAFNYQSTTFAVCNMQACRQQEKRVTDGLKRLKQIKEAAKTVESQYKEQDKFKFESQNEKEVVKAKLQELVTQNESISKELTVMYNSLPEEVENLSQSLFFFSSQEYHISKY